MKTTHRTTIALSVLAVLAVVADSAAAAFDSGSTGADGPFNPTANITVPLPPNGILNYTTVNIPSSVTVRFQRNATNTPVVILATGNVTIAGTIDVSGGSSTTNSNFADDGAPGVGGPGGYDGGRGGLAMIAVRRGGNGLGTGGGQPGTGTVATVGGGGGGGGFAGGGGPGMNFMGNVGGAGGAAYGNAYLQPLFGGSGGGGGGGNTGLRGIGGGGGGGGILIASSGVIDINSAGRIFANGGSSGGMTLSCSTACGGGGSGGAIRLVANAVRGNGWLQAFGGSGNCPGVCSNAGLGGAGSVGRIRIEADSVPYGSASTSPLPSVDVPGQLFLAGQPNLRITSVAGVSAPTAPTGNMDVTLPTSTTNPATVAFETSGVPVGSTINLTVTPPLAAPTTVQSGATSGSTASATATASVNIPTGHSVFQATVSYTVVASLGDALKNFANNERVERITLTATFGGQTSAKLTTVSGKEFEAPPEALQIAAMGN